MAEVNFANTSLYVGDLAADVTEALLFECFNRIGPVASVRVCRDSTTRSSLGYSYVNFHRVEDAERALDTMNYQEIRGKQCRIMWSQRDPSLRKSGVGNIFVNNLAKSIDNKSLYDTFSMFGNILSCKVSVNKKKEPLGYGFVHYETKAAAQDAIERVNGKVIAGKTVIVQEFKSKMERHGQEYTQFTNIYVKDFPPEISKDQFEEYFKQIGPITSSKLEADDLGNNKGYGFINYERHEDAKKAVDQLNGKEFMGKNLVVTRHQSKRERAVLLRNTWEQSKLDRQRQSLGSNLYVKNISETVTDEQLQVHFAQYGEISSVKIMKDSAEKSRGFGFVCFTSPACATKAIAEMNGKTFEGKPLYVSLAQPKVIRKAQLDAQYSNRKRNTNAPFQYGHQAGPRMVYPTMPQGNFMYPQQMMPQSWPGQVSATQQAAMSRYMMPAPVRPINYQLMPMPQRMPQQRMPQQRMQQRMPQRMPQQRMPQQRMPQQRMQPQHPAMQNSRQRRQNRQNQVPMMQNKPQPIPRAQAEQSAGTPLQQSSQHRGLTVEALAAAPEDQQKQMIGEALYPLIKQAQPELCGKITGMLLEMDNGELLGLLDNPDERQKKIHEAIGVLRDHPEMMNNLITEGQGDM